MSGHQQYHPPAPIVTDPQALGPTNTDALSPFSPPISPINTPRDLVPKGPLPYGGDNDLEKAIHAAMRAKDTKAWKTLIQARTVQNNVTKAPLGIVGEDLRPALQKLGWTDNEIKWAQAKADGDLLEGIKLLLKDEMSAHRTSLGGVSRGDEEAEDEDEDPEEGDENDQHLQSQDPPITSAVLRRLSIDSTWHLLQSTSATLGDEASRRRAWKENALLLVQVSSLQRQGRLSPLVKKKMKAAVAHGLGDEVRYLLKVLHQQDKHRDSVDREDSLFTCYKCPLTDDLLYEPVTLGCGHTFSKRALEGVISSGNRKCPICRGAISSENADELKVNLLLRDTITRLFSDRILQLVKRDIAALKSEHIETAAEELLCILQRYRANEDIIDMAVHTVEGWCQEKKNLAPLSRRGLGRELMTLLGTPSLRISLKFQRRTAVTILHSLNAIGSGSAHGAKILNDGAIWGPVFSLFEKPKLKGDDLIKLAVQAYRLVTLALKANQEPASISLEISTAVSQILPFVLENQQLSRDLVTSGLLLLKELVQLGQVKNLHIPVLSSSNALQVLGLWVSWTTCCEVVCAAASVLCTAIFQKNEAEPLISSLIAAGAVSLGLEALAAFRENDDLVLHVVPLLLRFGFSTDDEISISNETVCHKLKTPTFVAEVTRYLDMLEKDEQDKPLEDPIVFEKTSSSRIDIQENGGQVMANGKGWVVGSAITSGTWILTYDMLQEDKGDECSCIGVSLVSDPPANADYRSSGSPFITLRCFSGEVYRESRVLYASEAFKVHPGGAVRVTLDLEAGSLSFQVNDGPSILVASDLKGRSLYPAAYFYLGDGQPNRSTHPIIRLATNGSQIAGRSSMTVDAALNFTFPIGPPGRLYQEGQLVRRRSSSQQLAAVAVSPSSPASPSFPLTYAYGMGPGETTGVHTYLFKAKPSLSVCFGIMAADVIERKCLLESCPPDSINSHLLVAMWSTGRMASGGLPEGLKPVAYEGQDFIKPDEPVTFRLRLETRERVLEVVRGARVIHSIPDLDQRLPLGMALHPFIALLSSDDSLAVEYRILSQRHHFGADIGFDRRKWTVDIQTMLRDFNAARRSSRTPSVDPPSRLSLDLLLRYLEDPSSGPYKPLLLLEEVALRTQTGAAIGNSDTINITKSICRAMSRGTDCWEPSLRLKAQQLLAHLDLGLDQNGDANGSEMAKAMVRSGFLEMVVLSNDKDAGDSSEVYELLANVLKVTSSPVLQAYVVDLGMVLKLLAVTGPLKDKALDLILLLFQGSSPPVNAIRRQLVLTGQLSALADRLASKYAESKDSDIRHALLLLLLGGNETPDNVLLGRIVQQNATMTSANPYLIQPDVLDALTTPTASPPAAAAEVLMQRRKVTELQEGWRGHLSVDGAPSVSWNEAAFSALREGDVSLLRMLLAAPHFAAFVADRAVFAPNWLGPWVGILPRPMSLMGAHDALSKMGYGKAETRSLLLSKAHAFRRQKRESSDERTASASLRAPLGRYCRHPRADGTMGLFDVSEAATEPFGFQHNDLVYAGTVPVWGYARVLGVEAGRLWLQFQDSPGAVTSPEIGWASFDLRLTRANKDPGSGGASTTFRLPLERGTRVVRGPHWEWGNQDSFNGNVGTVLGNGGGDGWYRVQWDTTNTSNSYQYMESHQDLARYNDPLENPLATLFPPLHASQYCGDEQSPTDVLSSSSIVSANIRLAPDEPLNKAGFNALLKILESVWDPKEPGPIWSTIAKLGAMHPDHVTKLFSESAAVKESVNAAINDCHHPSALLLIACIAKNGPDMVLAEYPGLLARTLTVLTAPGSSDEQVVAGVSILHSLLERSSAFGDQFAKLLEGPTLDAMIASLLSRLLNPARTAQVSVHIMALRIMRHAIEADKLLIKRLESTPLKSRLVQMLEAYTQSSPSEMIVDELLGLVTLWFQGSDGSHGSSDEEVKRITIVAKAFFDDFDSVSKALVNAPKSLLCAATSILQRAVTSRRDAGSQEKTVSLILKSRTLDLLFGADWDWLEKDGQQILEVANLIEILLDAAPARKEDIVNVSLVQSIWPALEANDVKVVYAVLRVLEKHISGEDKEKRKKRPHLWWSSIGGTSLSTSLARTYARFVTEETLSSLILKVLADIVHETGTLDKVGFEKLVESQNLITEKALCDNHIAAILRIMTAAGTSLQYDMEVDPDQMVSFVAKWLINFADGSEVIDAGLQLLLSLVDESHVVLPDEVVLSSGSLATNKLFVGPLRTNDLSRSLKSLPSAGQSTRSLGASIGAAHFGQSERGLSAGTGGHVVEEWISGGRDYAERDDDALAEDDDHGEKQEEDELDPHGFEEEDQEGFADDGDEDNGDEEDDDDHDDERSEGSIRIAAQPGWQPTRTRLPHWVQLHLPRNDDGETTWRALELEQRDFQNSTPKVLEVSIGKLSLSPNSSTSLPLPVTSLRRVRIITQTNQRQTGWLSVVQADELENGEDVVEIRISANFGVDETASKLSRLRILARTRTSRERIKQQLENAGVLPVILGSAVRNAEKDRIFLRTVTLFLRRFFPEALKNLKEKVGSALANSEYDLAKGQAAGITFSGDGKKATFPFGPKLLVSALDTSEGMLRWIFKSSGNSSWAIGAIPKSKVDRHDVMMAEQSLAVATTGLAGGRISLRRQIQNRKLEAIVDVAAGCLTVTGDDDRDNPIVVDLPASPSEPYHLALMGYSGTVVSFLDDF